MMMNTRALNDNEPRPHFGKIPVVGTSTEETVRINALTYLDEMVKPVRSPGDDIRFRHVPHAPSMRDRLLWQEHRPWRIVLMPTDQPGNYLALELMGDVVLGSDSGPEANLDVNLVHLDGYNRGVSRRHLLLRPTRDKLFLIDLSSTNGSSINGMPSPKGEAHAMRDGDLVSLGRLHLQFKIARRPEPLER